MRILKAIQADKVTDPVRAKFAMVAPVLEASLNSLPKNRIERLGGVERITIADLGRELRSGDGDSGICFEFAVHEGIRTRSDLVYPLASQVLEDFCNIRGGSASILFGPEKDGRIPVIESATSILTDDSRLLYGRGRPAKLKSYIVKLAQAFRKDEERELLPRSIRGLWKADLFIGNPEAEQWVGTTVKSHGAQLEGAQGLRIGIYPQQNPKDTSRKDDDLNLIRLPLPYDSAFCELFYKSFFLVRAFLRNDAGVPPPVDLPDSEDRFVTKELQSRREFPVLEVLEVVREMSQPRLVASEKIETIAPTTAVLEVSERLESGSTIAESSSVSVSPSASRST